MDEKKKKKRRKEDDGDILQDSRFSSLFTDKNFEVNISLNSMLQELNAATFHVVQTCILCNFTVFRRFLFFTIFSRIHLEVPSFYFIH